MIRVLVVESALAEAERLAEALSRDPDIEIVGLALSGEKAWQLLADVETDLVVMSLRLPWMSGIETTRRIMATKPLPVILLSGVRYSQDVETTFKALAAGALSIVEIPSMSSDPMEGPWIEQLQQTVKAMAVMRKSLRWVRNQSCPEDGSSKPVWIPSHPSGKIQLVVIGASTGGPAVLQTILSLLPEDFPVPILIAQHITSGFSASFAEWLGSVGRLPVQLAEQGVKPLSGHVYIPPDEFQMALDRQGAFTLTRVSTKDGVCPRIGHLFSSVSETYGDRAVGVLLTGMGKDGAAELKKMREQGAVTIAQTKESSIVDGMPGEAIRLQAASWILPPTQIAEKLIQIVIQPDN